MNIEELFASPVKLELIETDLRRGLFGVDVYFKVVGPFSGPGTTHIGKYREYIDQYTDYRCETLCGFDFNTANPLTEPNKWTANPGCKTCRRSARSIANRIKSRTEFTPETPPEIVADWLRERGHDKEADIVLAQL